jgi:hypothetical protein
MGLGEHAHQHFIKPFMIGDTSASDVEFILLQTHTQRVAEYRHVRP